jgi:imidazolonepropionase-like amidohydrolase
MKNMYFAALAAIAIGTVGGCTSPSAVTEDGARTVVLQNFTMFDGTGAGPVENQSLIMVGDRIEWVGPSADVQVPAGAVVHDLTGQFVMPGIIDNHVHLGLDEGPDNYSVETIEKQLKLYAAYGVTTVQSLGTDADAAFEVRKAGDAPQDGMARVHTSGLGVVLDGGFGGMPNLPQRVKNADEARELVDAQKAKGADLIKFWVDDSFGDISELMPLSMSSAVISQAHTAGLKAVAHIFYRDSALELANNGVDGFGHEVRDKPVGADFIDAMKRNGTWQMAATLSREAAFVYADLPFLDDPFFSRGVTPKVLTNLNSAEFQNAAKADPHFSAYPGVFRTAMENFASKAKAGVRYGMGTDSGLGKRFPGYFAHWELELMVQAGLTPLQALTAATGSNAEFLGASDIGVIGTGKKADLLVLAKNPLEDIRNTRTISQVFVAGQSVPTIWQTCTGRPADACGSADQK